MVRNQEPQNRNTQQDGQQTVEVEVVGVPVGPAYDFLFEGTDAAYDEEYADYI